LPRRAIPATIFVRGPSSPRPSHQASTGSTEHIPAALAHNRDHPRPIVGYDGRKAPAPPSIVDAMTPFLAAQADDPSDLAPLLILADHLEEQGDATAGALRGLAA
jgi:uncharacterized protein (TIGR02996 family)